MALFFFLGVVGVFLAYVFWMRTRRTDGVCLLVLGPFSRSPRMQFHANCLANKGVHVRVVAYDLDYRVEGNEKPSHSIMEHHNAQPQMISWDFIPMFPELTAPGWVPRPMGRALYSPIALTLYRLFWSLFHLSSRILFAAPPRAFLVQTPPAVPTLGLVWVASVLYGCEVVVDWHNLGFSILEAAGRPWFVIGVYRALERLTGWLATQKGFCVSEKMKKWLEINFGIRCLEVLYDKAPQTFAKNRPDKDAARAFFDKPPFNEHRDSHIMVASSSYSPDERLDLLLEALERLDKKKLDKKVLMVLTGKGDPKATEEFRAQMRALELDNITTHAAFFDPYEDYIRCLWLSTIGVSLHTSSSGIDLPMKVVDCFGAMLPVVGLRYEALDELVKDETTGILVDPEEDGAGERLAAAMHRMLTEPELQRRIKANLEGRKTFEDEWNDVASHILIPSAQAAKKKS